MPRLRLRSYRRLAAIAWALVATGCADVRIETDRVQLTLPEAISCRPEGTLDRVELTVLGDGPTLASLVLTPNAPLRELPPLPFSALALTASARLGDWEGMGLRWMGHAGSELLLLPPGRSCALGDTEARAPLGAALVLGEDGALLVLGGIEGDRATDRVAVLTPGAQRAQLLARDLFYRSAFASATLLPDGRLMVAGGAESSSASARDAVEFFDPAAEESDDRALTVLEQPRRDHSALLLRDGRVLLAGGRDQPGPGSERLELELIDPETGIGRPSRELAHPRVRPTVLEDEDGVVWIAGGDLPLEVPLLECVDLERDRVAAFPVSLQSSAGEPELGAPLAVVALPGERIVCIGADELAVIALGTCAASDPPELVVASHPRWEAVTAVATPGGQVVILAVEDRSRAAYRFDAGTLALEPTLPGREASELVRLGDDSLAELSSTAGSLRREPERSRFDPLPASIRFGPEVASRLHDRLLLADPISTAPITRGAPAWEIEGDALVARSPGARVDVRAMRASRLHLVLESEGPLDVLLVRDSGIPVPIELESSIAIAGCPLGSRGSRVELDIEPGGVTHLGAQGSHHCAVPIAAPIGLAFRARDLSMRLIALELTRR